jgi:hypothetical protein
MNERIRALSDIAYKNHLAKNPHSSFGRRSDYDQELAELIVRECMELTKQCSTGKGIHDLFADEIIAEHFGVEK